MSTTFTSSVHQNQYLTSGASDVNAIMSVGSTGGDKNAAPSGNGLCVGLVADNSGSMDQPSTKIRAARTALEKAIEVLPETAYFFVIAGNSSASMVVPYQQATAANKARAIQAVRNIGADGGTYISTWLEMARDEFAKAKGMICQCILLTDGQNDEGDNRRIPGVLKTCAGVFQCDCRGVGTDWKVDQLRTIAGALMGTVDIIKQPADMAADFTALIEKNSKLAIKEVFLQVWIPAGAEIVFVKQVAPEIADITAKKQQGPNAQTFRFPTGAWGEETRDYHILIRVKVGAVGQKMLAGRCALVYTEGGVENKVGEAQLLAIWTEDEALSAVINPKVANYTGQAELAAKVQEGIAARAAGDEDKATKALGRALELAEETGNEGTKRLIEKVVEKDAGGTVRLRKNVAKEDAMELDTQSTRTKRVTK